tara:strand:- start:426 stop:2387 length:1962 start_codon:yes stop_codon:yes gene_type:complete
MALYDNLFEPLAVGPVTIPNRIVRSAHSTLLSGEPLIAYHEARARGGVGMSTLEATNVLAPEGTRVPLGSDAVLQFYEEISARMRPHGMKLFQQIYNPGATVSPNLLPSLESPPSVGEIPNPLYNISPMAMTRGEIQGMTQAFAAAARRVRDGGLDGVDIHASSGYLIHEFLSPALNHREDEYGGSFENRMRFLEEIIAAIRAEIGHDIAVGVRLPNEDYTPGGLTPELNAAIAQKVEDEVDYISLHMSSYWRFHKLIAPADDPLGTEMPSNRPITSVIRKPRMVVGRIMTLDHASAIVREGEGDLVSMVRALIADPELVNKARRLEESRIRPCIGTNMGCVGQIMSRGVLSCVVNRSAAQEDTHSFEPDDQAILPKKILVVGGGPAGLEAARTAALRGHRVSLHEATKSLGGQLVYARQAPHRADLGLIIDYLVSELNSLEVDISINSLVDEDVIADIAPDEIILATGSTPRTDGFQVAFPVEPVPGCHLPHVHTSWDVFSKHIVSGFSGDAVVFDDIGTFEAISVADVLLAAGLKVTMVSRFEKIGEEVPFPPVTVGAARERLMAGNFDFIGGHCLRRIEQGAVHIGVPFTARERTLAADNVVMVGFKQPNRDLVEAIRSMDRTVHLIGDALGRNDLMSAIHGGADIGRSI